MTDWVEQRVYGGNWPEPLLPMPACRGGKRDEKCKMCKSSISITLKPKEGICEYFPEEPVPVTANVIPAFKRAYVPDAPQQPKHKSKKQDVRNIICVMVFVAFTCLWCSRNACRSV